jgi:hypothetical protein
MRAVPLLPVLALLLAPPAAAQAPVETGGLVVRLGVDTLGMEHYQRQGDRIEVTVVARSPRTIVRRVVFELAPDGSVARSGTALREQTLEVQANPQPGTIPLVGGSWVSWDLVVRRAHAAGAEDVTVPVLAFNAVRPTPVRRTAPGTWTLPSQFDQAMTARVDQRGRMVWLEIEGGGTTVERVEALDIDHWASEFAARDAAGAGLGLLSPRESGRATVGGARIAVEYGAPSLRGRPLDVLAPPGEVWRTGANDASTLTTDRPLRFEGVTLDPGTWSVFAIPAAGAWTLIFNRQTGMSGLSRDPGQDVGRVTLRTRHDAPHAERFTIEVRPEDGGGALVLRWGGVEASAHFTVGG